MPGNYYGVYDAITDTANQEQQHRLAKQVGASMAGGDYTGASNALYNAGDLAGGQKVQTYSDTQRTQHAQSAQRISKGIRAAIAAGHTPQEAYEMATTAAPHMGVDPGELAQMRPAFDKDPRGFLDFIDQQANDTLKVYQSGNHVRGIDTATGKESWAYDMPGEPKVIGGNVYYPTPPASAPQPQPTSPNAPAYAEQPPMQGGQGGDQIPAGTQIPGYTLAGPARSTSVPFGWEVDENGEAHPTASFVRGKAQLAGATRAPARPRASGGRRAAIPPPPSGWSPR